jgi:hypothetical protein
MGLLALFLIVASSGCGTMANLEGRQHPWPGQAGQDPPKVFGGVRKDVQWIKTTGIPGNIMFVGDIPLSLIGDLVTLPKTVTSGRADPLLRTPDAGVTLSSLETPARTEVSNHQ